MSFVDQRTFRWPNPDPRATRLFEILTSEFEVEAPSLRLLDRLGVPAARFVWGRPMLDVWPEVLVADAQLAAYAPELAGMLERPARRAGSPETIEYTARLLAGRRRAFIDRVDLRDYLKALVRADARVLVVRGPRSSGRSYSWYLIAHLAESCRWFTSYSIDLASWAGAEVRPVDVANQVAAQLGWPAPQVDTVAPDVAVVPLLLGWFKGQARRERDPWWLVFDGFDSDAVTISDDTIRLVKGMASAADRLEAGELRVVLLAFDRDLQPELHPVDVLRDDLEYLGETEVREFFEGAACDAGRPIDAAGLDAVVEELLGQPPYPRPLPTEALALAGRAAFRLFHTEEGGHG